MSKMGKRISQIKTESNKYYFDYKANVREVIQFYNDIRDMYNAQMALINSERLSLREEIHKLYTFLVSLGGAVSDRKPTVFDYRTESFAPNTDYTEVQPIEIPDFREERFFSVSILNLALNHFKNKKTLADFERKVQEKKEQYDKDIDERYTQTKHLKDAVEIANIYRNIIVMVRDTVKLKIIPEFDLIQAFLFADAIRERMIEGGDLEHIEPCNIAEYKGTRQDMHYQFVKNVNDFYDVITCFFMNTVLTDILKDRIISQQEKQEFQNNIDNIKKYIEVLESKKVI